MRTTTIREFSYEDVRAALEKVHGPITGVKIANSAGYVLQECPADEQPRLPEEQRAKETGV